MTRPTPAQHCPFPLQLRMIQEAVAGVSGSTKGTGNNPKFFAGESQGYKELAQLVPTPAYPLQRKGQG